MDSQKKYLNKWVVITGSSQGLGHLCAEFFAKQGARLILVSRNLEKMEKVRLSCENSELHYCIAEDLAEKQAIQNVIAKIEAITHAQVDVLIHTAGGGYGKTQPLVDYDDFLLLFKVNVLSASQLNKSIIPWMKKKQSGNIIHVGSVASSEATGSVAYNSVKAALAAYVRSLGREVASEQVVVTGILPGGFSAPDNAMVRLKVRNQDFYQQFIDERLPRGKMGDGLELLGLIDFLSSPQASMMGGCMVPIDAGEGQSYYVS